MKEEVAEVCSCLSMTVKPTNTSFTLWLICDDSIHWTSAWKSLQIIKCIYELNTSALRFEREQRSKWKLLHFHVSENNKSPFSGQKASDLIHNMVWLFHSRHALADLVGIAEFFCKALDLSETFRIFVDVKGFKEVNLT